MTKRLRFLVVVFALELTACGTTRTHNSTGPSVQAKMICATEAQEDLAANLGTKPIRVTHPTWKDHVYSCDYVYPAGVVRLSVKDLSNAKDTRSYFDGLASRLGKRPDRLTLGQGAFFTKNGSVVVKKDFKVLEVDVSGLQTTFTQSDLSPSETALSFAITIMTCWTGK